MAKKLKSKIKEVKIWLLGKTKNIRWMDKPMVVRIRQNIHLISIIFFFLLTILSFLYPLSPSQKIKKQLLTNPQDFENHLQLAGIFLQNHQFQQVGKTLLLAQDIKNQRPDLVKQTNLSLEELWQEKQANDPEDIKKLIILWEEIVAQKPDYRDGFLQLAILNYKISENEKAEEFLKKALIVDPNFPLAEELKKIIPLF
jgi:tetratricopeptide (TPR) repeat protein